VRLDDFSNFGSLKSTETRFCGLDNPTRAWYNFSNFGSLKSTETAW